jgi:hypothetical protein
MATRGQTDKLEELYLALGHDITKNTRRRISKLSKEQASARITLYTACVRLRRETAIRTPGALATAAQVERLEVIRRGLREPIGLDELPRLFAMTRADMSILTDETELRRQAYYDAHGVPVPEWRNRMVNIKPETAIRLEAARRGAESRIRKSP